MASTVNGVPTPTTPPGIVQSFGNGDRISGDGHNNILQGNGGNNKFYGAAGNDTFIITAHSLASSSPTTDGGPAQAVIFDFQGAGTWSPSNNDFLALTGFGAGSTLTFSHYGGNADGSQNTHEQFYTVHSTATDANFALFINSVDGAKLAPGDYNFYG
jgi:Ca2+-binding RTX toxin-like protein